MELSGVMVTFSSPPSAFSGMVRVNTEPSAPVVARVPPVTGIRAVAALVPSSVTETLVGCGTTRLPLVPPAGPVEPAGPWSRRARGAGGPGVAVGAPCVCAPAGRREQQQDKERGARPADPATGSGSCNHSFKR